MERMKTNAHHEANKHHATDGITILPVCSRVCFHCGILGHQKKDCPSRIKGEKEPTSSGREAMEAFRSERERIRKEENGGKRSKIKKKHKYHYFHKIKSWIEKNKPSKNRQILPGDNERHFDAIIDPITVINRKLRGKEERLSSDMNMEEQILAKDLSRAYRGFFHEFINVIQNEFRRSLSLEYSDREEVGLRQDSPVLQNVSHRSTVVNREQREEEAWIKGSEFHELWHQPLNRAVKVGMPADFSNNYANQIYAVNLLEPRVRFLHHLVMDYNPVSNQIRKLLLPTPNMRNDGVTICSIGGGPGYDHISFCIIAAFLHRIQIDASYQPRKVHTYIFDLFDKDWASIMNQLESHVGPTISHITNEMNSSNRYEEKGPTNAITMHYCDVRLGIDNVANREVRHMLPETDIICLQYVLHENFSSLIPAPMKDLDNLRDDDLGIISGIVRDLLARAKVGAFMICTDSNNFLWPILKETATFYGWTFLGDAEKEDRISLGPKSFVVLERRNR